MASAAPVSTVEVINTPSIQPQSIPLGVNEFRGLALKYGMGSDQNDIFLPGSVACQGLTVPLFFSHQIPIGLAVLNESKRGVECRGRIMGSRLVGISVLRVLEAGQLRGLCLTSRGEESFMLQSPIGPVKVITKAVPYNLSIVIASGILGCDIEEMGPISSAENAWDQMMLAGGFLQKLQFDQALTWAAFAKQFLKQEEGDYESWIRSVSI
ncbi:MAG TPA: hypothetical protein VE398_16070 [Acidobacteriota bacterium]|nr:hypothetical protein [Acidobacteriota bacterium]